MAKRRIRSLPKRVVGVKIPRGLRRAAETPLGAAIIAGAVLALGREAFASQTVQSGMVKLRRSVARAALGAGAAMQQAAERADQGLRDAAAEEGQTPRKPRRQRADQEQVAH